ncbi:MAG: ribosome small subunit-dependent GTPase A, partial [Actinomycetota bacterium]|nr:ribosome small subunit-dependent GTPase A [Actinomycetota bacterium]
RIIRENLGEYIALGEDGEITAKLLGRLRYQAVDKSELPSVGDWVAAKVAKDQGRATIHALLPRKSAFIRKAAGKELEDQVVAANVETVFIVMGLDQNFNLRRIERYLSLAFESGATPVILLNKADLCEDLDERVSEVEAVVLGVEVHPLSATKNIGLEVLDRYIAPGLTVAFLGSSGVGKSTIINTLLGSDRLKTAEVILEGSRGRHTTTFRELILLPSGGMVIDTPGMREIQVTGDEEGLKQVFGDILELAQRCKFNDCSHEAEIGCAVKQAVSDGQLLEERLESYLKLKKEFAYQKGRQEMRAAALEEARWKKISQLQKDIKSRGKK